MPRSSSLHSLIYASAVLGGIVLSVGQYALAQEDKPPTGADFRWGDAQYVFTGKLVGVQARGVALSEPPIYNHVLTIEVDKSLRGTLKSGESTTLSHSARQKLKPVFPEGKICLLAARMVRNSLVAEVVLEADQKTLDLATLSCSLPVGWKLEGGKPVSPWAALGEKGWAVTSAPMPEGMLVCAKTGRPALRCGSGVSFEVEHVPPKAEVKFGNPDGDGEYKLTVKNQTDKPLVVPALLTKDSEILWEESLAILCQNKTYVCPGSKGVSGKVEAKTLAPGESISTVVNVLRLQGPEWPKGGYRIEFRFCLGELSQTKSFYYLSRHHDAVRASLAK